MPFEKIHSGDGCLSNRIHFRGLVFIFSITACTTGANSLNSCSTSDLSPANVQLSFTSPSFSHGVETNPTTFNILFLLIGNVRKCFPGAETLPKMYQLSIDLGSSICHRAHGKRPSRHIVASLAIIRINTGILPLTYVPKTYHIMRTNGRMDTVGSNDKMRGNCRTICKCHQHHVPSVL